MSVRYYGFGEPGYKVLCDEPDCKKQFDCDDMTENAAEARYHAIYAGWQSIKLNGRLLVSPRLEYCPEHVRKASK